MIFAHSLIGHIGLGETLYQVLHGAQTLLQERNADDEQKLEWMFLVILSRHLVRLRIATLHRSGVHFETARRFALISLMIEGN